MESKKQNPLEISTAERAQVKIGGNQTLVIFKRTKKDLEDQKVSVSKTLERTIRCFFHIHAFFYKQYFYKQRQAEINKKSSKCYATP